MDKVLKAVQEALHDDISAWGSYVNDRFKFIGQSPTTTFYKDEDGKLFQVRVEVTEVV